MSLLKGKNAVVYGAGGAIGGAVARAFAREGARVFLVGRTRARLEAVARDIAAADGTADVTPLDAMDEGAVERHAHAVAETAGSLDIALNAVGLLHVQGTPFFETSFAEYALPLHGYTRTNFLTAKAAARQMVRRGSGVLLTLSTPGSRLAVGAGFLGFGAACACNEALTRHLAGELGPSGVRVVCLRPDAVPEAIAKHSHSAEVFRKPAQAAGLSIDEMLDAHRAGGTLLKRLPTLGDVAEAAVFYASDRAAASTGVIVNLTCGSLADF